MSYRSKITIAAFILIPIAMAGLFYGLPFITAQTRLITAAIFIGTGLVLSGILSGITCAVTKNIPGKPVEVKEEKAEAPPMAEKAPFDEKAVQVISVLQKKGRLIDFLQEDITNYEDSQIGAAVRNIHKDCRDAIGEYMTIEQVMTEQEGSSVTIAEGFDPSAVRLTGNIAGSPPFTGVLRHSGWRASSTSMPPLPQNQDLSVIEPAEVEVV